MLLITPSPTNTARETRNAQNRTTLSVYRWDALLSMLAHFFYD
jgi:hypothetical protein